MVRMGTWENPASSSAFPEQGAVVGQTAVAHVFAHGDRRVVRVVLSAAEGRQGLTDNDLGRETDVVVDILLSKPDGLLLFRSPGARSSRPAPQKSAAMIRLKAWDVLGTSTILSARSFFCKFHWIGVLKLRSSPVFSSSLVPWPLSPGRNGRGCARGPWMSLSSSFRTRGDLPGDLVHQPDNLIREVGVVAAAKAHDLHVLQTVAPEPPGWRRRASWRG